MDIDSFAQELASMHERVARLQNRDGAEAKDPFERSHDSTLAELNTALEELTVANEELRQQNEELLRAWGRVELEQRRYQQLFHMAPEGYLLTDAFGKIEAGNRAVCEMLGVDERQLVGKPLAVFLPEGEVGRFRTLLLRMRIAGSGVEREVELRARDGQVFPAALAVSVDWAEPDSTATLRWLVRDLRERRRVEVAERNESVLREYCQRLEALVSKYTEGQAGSGSAGVGPDPGELLQLLAETVGVLLKTKSAFRSKDLAQLRKRLESFLARWPVEGSAAAQPGRSDGRSSSGGKEYVTGPAQGR